MKDNTTMDQERALLQHMLAAIGTTYRVPRPALM
jgi:hypothetical protein